jgi:hypothetical protein
MEGCWANILGDCNGGLSGEHIITESLFLGDCIGVKGLPWCREGHKFIGKASYTANILCRSHNSDLSPVDDAGANAFAAFRMMTTIYNNRSGMLQYRVWCGRFDVIEQHVDGAGLERWLLKTLINMELAGKQSLPVGPNAPAGGGIDPALVEIAFGLRSFLGRAGLYFAAFDAEAIDMQERVQYTSWIMDAEGSSFVAAGAFSFFGFRFFLCLEEMGFPDSVNLRGRELKLLHHINMINVDLNNRPSQQVNFSWVRL